MVDCHFLLTMMVSRILFYVLRSPNSTLPTVVVRTMVVRRIYNLHAIVYIKKVPGWGDGTPNFQVGVLDCVQTELSFAHNPLCTHETSDPKYVLGYSKTRTLNFQNNVQTRPKVKWYCTDTEFKYFCEFNLSWSQYDSTILCTYILHCSHVDNDDVLGPSDKNHPGQTKYQMQQQSTND
jgi:hypothetical protein